jgi:hypothetical protein
MRAQNLHPQGAVACCVRMLSPSDFST